MSDPNPGPMILAIETSSEHGQVALAKGPALRAQAELATTSRHCQGLLPTIRSLCERVGWRADDLQHVYVSAGPGSFTGLRIAITTARSLALALGLKVVAVPTTRVIAARAEALSDPPENLAVVLDAKRGQIYGSLLRFLDGRYETVLNVCVLTPAKLLERAPRPLTLTGEGLAYHARECQGDGITWLPEELRQPRAHEVQHLGWEMALRGEFTPASDLVPVYVRPPEAEEKWAARQDSSSVR